MVKRSVSFAAMVAACSFALSAPVAAKGPKDPEQAHKVACAKNWHVYRKEHGLKGSDRAEYMEKCMAGPAAARAPR
jgi:hypothetical protein